MDLKIQLENNQQEKNIRVIKIPFWKIWVGCILHGITQFNRYSTELEFIECEQFRLPDRSCPMKIAGPRRVHQSDRVHTFFSTQQFRKYNDSAIQRYRSCVVVVGHIKHLFFIYVHSRFRTISVPFLLP
jgi:hypothetical protein